MSDDGSTTAGVIILIIAAAFYLLPAIIASSRRHQQAGAIWVLTIFLGWTLIGWVAALVWASTRIQREPVANSYTAPPAPPVRQTAKAATDADEIERFAQLRDNGTITDEEFTAKKRALLGLS